MWSALKEFLKSSSETEAQTRRANVAVKSTASHFALFYGQHDKSVEAGGKGTNVSNAWERNKERVFILLYAYGGIFAGLISSSIVTSIQPLFLVISVYFTNPTNKYLYGLAIGANEIGFLVSVTAKCLISKRRSSTRILDIRDDGHRIILIQMGLYLSILSITGYILSLIFTEKIDGSAALYLIIIARFTQGICSYGQLASFSLVSEHFLLHARSRHETLTIKKKEEQLRRKLVTRYDFTFLDARLWWGPLLGFLFFFLIPDVRHPLRKSRKEFLIMNFYTANAWLFLILCILAVFLLRRQHPTSRSMAEFQINGSEESKSESCSSYNVDGAACQGLEGGGSSDSDNISDGVFRRYNATTNSVYHDGKGSSDSDCNTSDDVYYSSFSGLASAKHPNNVTDSIYHSPTSDSFTSEDYLNACSRNSTKNPVLRIDLPKDQLDVIADPSICRKPIQNISVFPVAAITTGPGLILILVAIDLVMKFCVWGLYFVLFAITLQFDLLKKQRDLWKIYLPIAVGGILACLIDFRKINGYLSRYRSSCLKRHALISVIFGMLSLLLSFLLLLGIVSFMNRENAKWCLVSSLFFLGTGIAWFFKPCQGITLELISKLHNQQDTGQWLCYLYAHILGSSCVRLLGTLIAGTLLVFQPKFSNNQSSESITSLQCGITTQSYVIGVYVLTEIDSSKRSDVSCSLTYYKEWLIFNIALICSAIILLFITIVKCYFIEYVTVSDVLSSSSVDLSAKRTKRPKVKFAIGSGATALNPENESDAIRYLYNPGDDISDLQYDVRD